MRYPIEKTVDMVVLKARVKGWLTVDYPKASLDVAVSVTAFKDRSYKLRLDPARGIWEDQDTHAWLLYPVTLRVRIKKADLKHVNVAVLGKKARVFWDDDYDIYDPFKSRKVEMFAQPAFIKPIKENADHTYAAAYDASGKRTFLWPCGGDHDKKQRSIGTGRAFPPECDCLSLRLVDPLTKGLAGIRYGVDGVCHQATNRIMCPGGLEVTRARAYKKAAGWKNLSYTLYGRLGLKWPDGVGVKVWKKTKKSCLMKAHPFCQEDISIAAYLGEIGRGGLRRTQIDDLLAEREAVMRRFRPAFARLKRGRLSGREFAHELNGHIGRFLGAAERMLGTPAYRRLFEVRPGEDVRLVVPQLAARAYANGVPDYLAMLEG
jgi:hypothetical protein